MARDGHLSWASGLLDLGLDLISARQAASWEQLPSRLCLFLHPPCRAGWQFLPPWALLTSEHHAVIRTP